jgi:hypothetical protein
MSQNTIGWVQSAIFLVQTVVFGIQAYKLNQTVAASTEQSKDSKESIRQARRAADAMAINSEYVARITATTTQQVRAYLAIQIGSGVYQDEHSVFQVPAFGIWPQWIGWTYASGGTLQGRAGSR